MLWKNDVVYIPPETKAEKSFVCNPILKFRVAQVTLFFFFQSRVQWWRSDK